MVGSETYRYRDLKLLLNIDICLTTPILMYPDVTVSSLTYQVYLSRYIVTGLEVKPYHGLRHSLMAGHKLWSWRGIVLRRCQ